MKIEDTILLAGCLFLFPTRIIAQTDTLVDVFPLTIGNQWTYDYSTSSSDYILNWTISDLGTAVYTILGSTEAPDSIRWLIRQRRDVIHCIDYYFPGPDTCYPLHDSTTFELVEKLQSPHRLYRNNPEGEIWNSVFAFARDLGDTSYIFRYMTVDSTGLHALRTRAILHPHMEYDFVFSRAIGLTTLNARSINVTGGSVTVQHHLLGSTIVAVKSEYRSPDRSYSISQNYPNPFNGTTTIQFQLASPGTVSLRLYNNLGALVETVIDGHFTAGNHSAVLDLSRLASAVYFVRLEAAGIIQMRKLVLLK